MNREEIIKEARMQVNCCTPLYPESFIQGYIAGAESREKKIADIKANCDLAIEGRDVKIKELELELTVEKDQHQEEINLHLHAEDYIKSLEKENAELKDKLNKIERKCKFNFVDLLHDVENESKQEELLTKAKEIIKKYMLYCKGELTHYKDIEEQAEQFLKGENIILEDAQAGNSPFDADEVFNKEMKAYPDEK